ncbi:MAG: DUF4292 domain-containing protein [Proteobacteria bacterium]|nr:DUF4292 domain-containing protein [Pseudomonadota bacterium]MBU4011853.1 DUF4292 domain-containing protein [Pseudomonadota bacterium]MBU4069137.1 DUF4292 domain-containing protein [Pseudomonadota bacterium]MBU4101681.1 DUF4292 domain-containing protein [Pseudomonadota bacterium]MBU4126859.1 DUF4292 domain-containing protein [Pseudomonadota bacterium]
MKQVIILFIIVFFSACSFFTERIVEEPPELLDTAAITEVNNLLSNIRLKNRDLKTFKGIGKITFLEEDKKSITSSIAWVGSGHDMIRIAILNISGQPLLSLANDGQWFYFLSHTDNGFYKKRSSYSNLKKVIQLPIKPVEMVSFLAGRIPLCEYNTADIISNKEEGYVIVLKKKGNVIQKIYLNEDKKNVQKVEMFEAKGNLLYSIEIDGSQKINEYRVPMRIIAANDNGNKFKIDIHKYWVDVSVDPSMFVLTPQLED